MNEGIIHSIGSASVVRIVQFRIREGADLINAIVQAAAMQKIVSGVIISGVGALNKAIFRNLTVFPKSFPVQPEDRIYLEVKSPMELVSLGGWIAPHPGGITEIHAHFSASTVRDGDVCTLGGHLTEGTVAGIKVVIAIAVLEPGSVRTELDPVTKAYDLLFC